MESHNELGARATGYECKPVAHTLGSLTANRRKQKESGNST